MAGQACPYRRFPDPRQRDGPFDELVWEELSANDVLVKEAGIKPN